MDLTPKTAPLLLATITLHVLDAASGKRDGEAAKSISNSALSDVGVGVRNECCPRSIDLAVFLPQRPGGA